MTPAGFSEGMVCAVPERALATATPATNDRAPGREQTPVGATA
jgi:hypothetical protein